MAPAHLHADHLHRGPELLRERARPIAAPLGQRLENVSLIARQTQDRGTVAAGHMPIGRPKTANLGRVQTPVYRKTRAFNGHEHARQHETTSAPARHNEAKTSDKNGRVA